MSELENNFSDIGKNRFYSKFLCQEMLIDYLLGRLDPIRKSAVTAALEKHEDLRKQKQALEKAMKYCEDLSHLKMGEAFINRALAPLTLIDSLKQRFSPKRWPIPLKWGLEALVVSGLVATITLIMFWSNIQSMIPVRNETVLVRQQIKKEEHNLELKDQKEIADFHKKMSESILPEEAPTPVVVAPGPMELPQVAIQRIEKPKVEVEKKTVALRKPEVPPTESQVQLETQIEPNSKVEVAETPKPKPAPKPVPVATPKGYVYKLVMNLPNLEVIGPEIAEKIIALGAIKAGEVEIGWRKPNGNYYHFVLDKERGQDLEDLLKSYGEIQVVRDPHSRVMPENQDRYILWIEDK